MVAWAFGWWLLVIAIVSSVCSIVLIDRDNERRLARHACALARHVPSGTCSPTDAETVVVNRIVAIAADNPTTIQMARRRVEAIFDPWRRSLAIERLDAASAQVPPARRRAAATVAIVALVALSATAASFAPQLFAALAACLTVAVAQLTRRRATTHSISEIIAIAAAVDPLGEQRTISERAVIDVIRDSAHNRTDILRRAERDSAIAGPNRDHDPATRRLAAAAALATDARGPRLPTLLVSAAAASTTVVVIALLR